MLRSHALLQGVFERWYYDDNTDAASSELLRASGYRIFEGDPFEVEYSGHDWTEQKMRRMAGIRDCGIHAFLETDADALLIVDADVVLPPSLPLELAARAKFLPRTIVSAVYWSKWPGSDTWMPNVWDVHNYKFANAESILRLRKPGVYRVGGLGAVALIMRDALEAGCCYEPIPNLGWPGEDRHFCTRAQALGFELAADTAVTPFHVYRPEQLEEARVWYESGCPRSYFDSWLDDIWVAKIREQAEKTVSVPLTPSNPRVLAVCTPGETFSAPWLWHYFELWTSSVRAKWGFAPFQGYCTNPYVTRANMTRDVLACPVKPRYVLWIDDDNLVDWAHVEKLIRDLDEHPEAAAVAGWAWIQSDSNLDQTTRSSVGRWVDGNFFSLSPNELDDDELIEIDATGFPCLLMRRELLEAVGPDAFFPDQRDCTTHFIGEDVAFCLAAKRAGYRIFCDGRVHVPHMKLRQIQPVLSPNVGNLIEREQV